MKQLLFIGVALLLTKVSYSQIGVGTPTPNSSALLDVFSTTKGFLPPRMTQAQRNAITSPTEGLVVYCTTCTPKGLSVYDGSQWSTPSSSSISARTDAATIVSPITSSTGRVWMDRNLGASRRAQSATDYLAYGQLYQWGRGNDGHADIVWTSGTAGTPLYGTTTTVSPTDNPANNLYIAESIDWRATQNNNLWQGILGINNPCPAGYRLPTITELNAEITAYAITNIASAFASPLKFTAPGYRYYSPGTTVYSISYDGYYWTSSLSGSSTICGNFFTNGAGTGGNFRANALSIRCIKD